MPTSPLEDWLNSLGVSFPFFIRNIDTASADGTSCRDVNDRARVILDEVLDPDDYVIDPNATREISVYEVASKDEVLKVVMTLALFRQTSSEQRVYVIAPIDLQNLPHKHTPDNCKIPCYYTRSRHCDLLLNQAQREELARRLAAVARHGSPKIRKRLYKPFQDRAVADGCYSTVTAASTQCIGCDPSGQHAPARP
jgi:hypothetical protein